MKERSGPAAANIAIRASFLPLCLFAASSQNKPGWNLPKKNILHKGKRNREEGFSSIYAVRKLSSAAVNKGEGC